MLEFDPLRNRKTVYIETTIVSYLTARPSRDLFVAAWQNMTAEWWKKRSAEFDLVTSEAVWNEAKKGDAEAAQRRIEALAGIEILPVVDAVESLAEKLISAKALPPHAVIDALHIAYSAVHEVDYLLTWNFRHLDNAESKPLIRTICAIHGFTSPEICTPGELMGDADNVG